MPRGRRADGSTVGRPTKLDAALTERICEQLGDGAHLETVCEAEGIGRSTLYLWLDKGIGGQEPYATFVDLVTRARARAELAMLRDVRTGAGGKTQGKARGSAWVLERTRPERYAQRVNLKIEEAVGQVLEVVRGVCSAEDFERIRTRLEGLDREGGEVAPPGDPDGSGAPVH